MRSMTVFHSIIALGQGGSCLRCERGAARQGELRERLLRLACLLGLMPPLLLRTQPVLRQDRRCRHRKRVSQLPEQHTPHSQARKSQSMVTC